MKEQMKSNLKRESLGLLVVSTTLGAIGQVMFKYSMSLEHALILTAAIFITGIIAYGISTLFYFYALSKVHLSWAYSIGGLSYIIAVILAATVLLEKIPLLRWIGVLVITLGLIIVGIS